VADENLEGKTNAELTEIYNQHVAVPIKKFRDRATALERTKEALNLKTEEGSEEVAKTKTAKKAKKPVGEGKKRGRPVGPRTPFDLPASDEISTHREGTKRATLIEMLKEGATIEEVMKKIDWDRRTAFEGIRLLHKSLGYGLKENTAGVIKLVGRP